MNKTKDRLNYVVLAVVVVVGVFFWGGGGGATWNIGDAK